MRCYCSGVGQPRVVVTTEAVWTEENGRWQACAYADIAEVLGPGEGDPRDAAGVWVRLHDGSKRELAILGGDDRLRDAWEFTRFFSRVMEDRGGT